MSSPKYWREIPQRYRLEAERCVHCGMVLFPPRIICPQCRGRQFEPVRLAREGNLLTWTVIRVAPSPFVDQAPYAVGIVELAGGVKIMAQIADCEPERLSSGMPLRVEFRKIQEEGEAGIIAYGYKCVPAENWVSGE
jgi:uncharacterized OB-fold protein